MNAQYTAVEKFMSNTIKATRMNSSELQTMQQTQVDALKSAFLQTEFDVQDASDLQATLSEPSNAFSAAQREELASVVARLSASRLVTSKDSPKKRDTKLQDCSGFPSMLTDKQWDEIEAAPDLESKVQLLVKFMLLIGLRNPTEPTKKVVLTMAAIANDTPLGATAFYKELQKMTNLLTRMRKSPTFPPSTMSTFPASGAALKTMCPHVYPDDDPVPSRVPVIDIDRRAPMYGTRNTMRALRPDCQAVALRGPMQMADNSGSSPDMAMLMRLGQMIAQATRCGDNNQMGDIPIMLGSRSGIRNRTAALPIMPALGDTDHNVDGGGRASNEPPSGDVHAHEVDVVGDAAVVATTSEAATNGLAVVREELRKSLEDKANDAKERAAEKKRAKNKKGAKSKTAAKGKAKASPNAKTKAPISKATTRGKMILGCSKCRYVVTGCSTCKDPTFTGKRGRH